MIGGDNENAWCDDENSDTLASLYTTIKHFHGFLSNQAFARPFVGGLGP